MWWSVLLGPWWELCLQVCCAIRSHRFGPLTPSGWDDVLPNASHTCSHALRCPQSAGSPGWIDNTCSYKFKSPDRHLITSPLPLYLPPVFAPLILLHLPLFMTSCNSCSTLHLSTPSYLHSSLSSLAPKAQRSSSRAGLPGTLCPLSPIPALFEVLSGEGGQLCPGDPRRGKDSCCHANSVFGDACTKEQTRFRTYTLETGQSSCSHAAEGVLYSRTAWVPVWSSMAVLCSVLGHLFCTQVWNAVVSPDEQTIFTQIFL